MYWTRRLVLLAVAFALVFGFARVLGGGNGGGTTPSAQPVGAEESSPSSPTSSAASSPASIATAPTVTSSPTGTPTGTPKGTPTGKTDQKNAKSKASSTASPLPESSGPCSTSDIVATPTIKDKAHAGKPVVFAMRLTTKSSPACDFSVAPDSMVVRVTSGSDRIWSTQDCPASIPKKSVVLRKDTPVSVDVTWSGMRSDSDCSRATTWAQPGYYHAMAAVFGADPVDEQFELLKPTPRKVTAKPSPTAKPNDKSDKSPAGKTNSKATSKPDAKPSSKPTKKPGH